MRIKDGDGRGATPRRPTPASPDPRHEPPADALSVVPIAWQLRLQDAVLCDGAVQKKWQAEDGKERRREPGVERKAARDHDDDAGEISGMPNNGVRTACDDTLAAIGLDTDYRREEPIHDHGPEA